jgi:hypothetical protein
MGLMTMNDEGTDVFVARTHLRHNVRVCAKEVPGIDPDPCAPMRSGSRRPLDESAVSLGHLVPLGDAIRPEPRPVCSGKDAARNDRASA